MTTRHATFAAEKRESFGVEQGLPSLQVNSMGVDSHGTIYAGTDQGLAQWDAGRWRVHPKVTGQTRVSQNSIPMLVLHENQVLEIDGDEVRLLGTLPPSLSFASISDLASGLAPTRHGRTGEKRVWLGTDKGLFELQEKSFQRVPTALPERQLPTAVRQIAVGPQGQCVLAAEAGLRWEGADGEWESVFPYDGHASWAPRDVRGVAFDSHGHLWFASPQGVGRWDGHDWTLFAYQELPYNDFTTVSHGESGVMWFGTRIGAIRFDGEQWEYRMAPRWLPGQQVRSIAVTSTGDAWIATDQGIGAIRRTPLTLAQKAQWFEEEIDRYHRRTPYGFVMSVKLARPADKSEWTQSDSDNDGLWTSMYGAGECFAYAATKDPLAKRRATAAFEALRFLSQVTQGGTNPAPRGFPARSILPVGGPNPNHHDTPERDRRIQQESDEQWKVISPRWPTSADGQWYWKSDTSSDELDGHFFFYAAYYDLVAETPAEKAAVRDVVMAIADHLLEHDYQLLDHDGKPTRWGRFNPQVLNGGILDGARGLNSLSILSYLRVAQHMSGESRYDVAIQELIEQHAYDVNLLDTKRRNGPGAGNHSDDEMAFMCFYNLIRYESNPDLRAKALWAVRWYWLLEEPEKCPLFNLLYAAVDEGTEMEELPTPDVRQVLGDAIETLHRIPLDRIRWGFQHSHRTDLVPLPAWSYRSREGGHLRNGSVIPIDERDVEYWNHDPWHLDSHQDGRTLTDGSSFLLPYYLGLYLGVIAS